MSKIFFKPWVSIESDDFNIYIRDIMKNEYQLISLGAIYIYYTTILNIPMFYPYSTYGALYKNLLNSNIKEATPELAMFKTDLFLSEIDLDKEKEYIVEKIFEFPE